MTETSEGRLVDFIGSARLKVRPGAELTAALDRFIRPGILSQLGGNALSLRSGHSLSIYRRIDGATEPSNNVSVAQLVRISRDIDDRKSAPRPTIYPGSTTLSRYEPSRPGEHPGIDIAFRVPVEELTRRALQSTLLLQDDGSIWMHFTLRDNDMVKGVELQKAGEDFRQTMTGRHVLEPFYISTPHPAEKPLFLRYLA